MSNIEESAASLLHRYGLSISIYLLKSRTGTVLLYMCITLAEASKHAQGPAQLFLTSIVLQALSVLSKDKIQSTHAEASDTN